jgi:hypothetical protein
MRASIKKTLLLIVFGLIAKGVWSQNNKGPVVITAAQTVQTTDLNGRTYTIQVGLPFVAPAKDANFTGNNYSYIRFPWDVLYLYDTFSEEEESFDVSKGFFGDKILLKWVLRANYDIISRLVISRREYTTASSSNWVKLGSVSKDVSEYEDKYVEGGTLYEYKVEAIGVDGDIYLQKYITGVGFRSPTAVVTGNVNYDGGSPVSDVTVTANADGSNDNLGAAINIKSGGSLNILSLNKPIDKAATLQAWIKPENPNTAFNAFTLKNGSSLKTVLVKHIAAVNSIEVTVDGAVFSIKDFYPTGVINARGDDELVAISHFSSNYTHISVVLEDGAVPKLFINGRQMDATYATLVQNIEGASQNGVIPKLYETFGLVVPTKTIDLTTNVNLDLWNSVFIGGSGNAFFDEIRIWKTALSNAKIRTDYKRYISGNDARLISYIRAEEGLGNFAYDYSRNGFNYNKNHGALVNASGTNNVLWVSGAGNIPAPSQLGVLGVTDANGNYEISAIPYSGVGESFRITPSFGLHKFEPSQKIVYLGEGSTVINDANFIDKSSFIFKGKVMYDTRNVFKSFVEVDADNGKEGDTKISGPGIIDEGYNYYEKSGERYSKGEYWLNDNATPTEATDDYLERYALIGVEEANIFVDGQMVLDENNLPIVSDKEGNFEVTVPIGNHYITVKKTNHEFVYNGRFPAATGEFKEFFEDAEEQVVFIDQTRVTLVGKVVGGTVEAEKEIGFGENGLFTKDITDDDEITTTIQISSKNNIGVANIALGYKPTIGDITNYTRTNFTTNSTSGEYRIDLLPLSYEIDKTAGITIGSSTSINLLEANVTLNLTNVFTAKTPEYLLQSGEKLEGIPYNFEKSFNYRATPVLEVTEQTSDPTVAVNGSDISTVGFVDRIYTQFGEYTIKLNRFERYTNKDAATDVEDLVSVSDGELIVNNNLAIPNSETINTDANDAGILIYTFRAGLPSTDVTTGFKLDNTMNYRLNGVDYPVVNLNPNGIVLGGASDGSSTFVTKAPDIPSIILRDPPGSESFASIESGTSISFTTNRSFAHEEGVSQNLTVKTGVEFIIGGGLAGPVVDNKVTSNLDVGIGLVHSSKDGTSLTQTYTFNQTISTSSESDYVGDDGDLYIGNSKNIKYGTYDNVQLSNAIIGEASDNFELTNAAGESVYMSKQKAITMVDDPTETFFVYSQNHILTYLIPQYELFIKNIGLGLLTEGSNGILSKEEYLEQIRLWKVVILENEKEKWLAKNDRAQLKKNISTVIADFDSDITDVINRSSNPAGEADLIKKINKSESINTLLKNGFEANISFDSGVGELTRSVETVKVREKQTEYNLKFEESFEYNTGFTLNGIGLLSKTAGVFQQDINTNLSETDENTSIISYTLKDSDPANVLSVDVVNTFDGNGPIFITQAGNTSCPYEGAEVSKFYAHIDFDTYFTIQYRILNDIRAKKRAIKLKEIEAEENSNDLINDIITYNVYLSRNESIEASKRTFITEKETLEIELENHELDFNTNFRDFTAESAPSAATLSEATVPVEKIKMTVVGSNNVSNVPDGKFAEFTLKLENLSDAVSTKSFHLKILNTSDPYTVINNFKDPAGDEVEVSYGTPAYYTLRIGKSKADVFDYDNLVIIFESLCDPGNTYSNVTVSAHFIPSCSDVVVSAPSDNWVFNRDNMGNALTNTPNTQLPITLTEFNTDFASFNKIVLEYRLATAPNWSHLHTYYGSQSSLDVAAAAGETDITLISSSAASINYNFDIIGRNLQNGNYEIRARSSCTNNTEVISDVITGTVDLTAPQRFGTPLPIDGLLGPGEDLRVSFSENIFYNSAVSNIEIKGATNQLPINNSVSIYFEGVDNTVTIDKPRIVTGDFSLEFWMNNATVGNATIFAQQDGLNISLVSGDMVATLGGLAAKGAIATDNNFNHYTITYNNDAASLSIYENDIAIAGTTSDSGGVQFTNSYTLVIGGNTFKGNIHDLRLWNKSLSLANAYANIYTKILGNEANLLGYWPMNEGNGTLASDLASYKHAKVNATWDIKPKGNAYAFASNHYLELENLSSVQLTKNMDATISFWIKTETGQDATLFSNGRGDATDSIQSNGLRNKWAINMNSKGNLTFESENVSYSLTTKSVADNGWHHIALLLNRGGALKTYVDAQQVSSNPITGIGGFSGSKAWLGARGYEDVVNNAEVDNFFTGKLDEFRLWNSVREVKQISRDRFYEVDNQSAGLILYARMNAPYPLTGNGPRYYHKTTGTADNTSSTATLKNGSVSYTDDAPAIKPERSLIKFQVSHVINQDNMILEPVISDWAVLEGQVLDITVNRMFDSANNMQESPITWTAYVQKNEVSWFVDGFTDVVDLVNYRGDELSFEITLTNSGGLSQPFAITNVPNWMQLSASSGILTADSKKIITATIDKELAANVYNETLYLETDFGFNQKLPLTLRVLEQEPDWSINSNDYAYSANIVGRIIVDGLYSEDIYDRIGVFHNDELSGVAKVVYNSSYQQYYVFLTIYSNSASGDELEFRIWDASEGKILQATIGDVLSSTFISNEIKGNLVTPILFKNTSAVEQNIALNRGWTWVSLNVDDVNFNDINILTNNLVLQNKDRILSNANSAFEVYTDGLGWDGSISLFSGGLSVDNMYKISLGTKQSLKIKGTPVEVNTWSFPIVKNWNWLPFVLSSNLQLNDAMSSYTASAGDVIKSQNLFAIYDQLNGWIGSLNYLEESKGYLLKSLADGGQTFQYPSNFGKTTKNYSAVREQEIMKPEFTKYPDNMNAIVLLPEGYNELLVFDSEHTLKGISKKDTYGEKELSFITIYGDETETLEFYKKQGADIKPTGKTFSFNKNALLGTYETPIDLGENIGGVDLYPNPFTNVFSLLVDVNESQTVLIKIYNLTGQLVYKNEVKVIKGITTINVEPKVSNGIYVLHLVTNKETLINKIIKE